MDSGPQSHVILTWDTHQSGAVGRVFKKGVWEYGRLQLEPYM